ncbi:MAG: ACT domain-containing protein [Pseudomonadota bacterium]
MTENTGTLLKLTVNNHPGVLSHISGLFARRAYNLEAVMVRPIAGTDHRQSRIWLLVHEGDRLNQVLRHTEKLVDVISIEQQDMAGSIFEQTEAFFS